MCSKAGYHWMEQKNSVVLGLRVGDPVPKPPNPRSEEEIIAQWKGEFDKPVVSISCITYNHGKYIEDALKGFLNQFTDFPFEILIHDDASTDDTANIIKRYESQYPNLIKPIYQVENQYSKGRRVTVDFNFSRASGQYIAICEGDDYWVDERKLQIQKDFLDSNPEYVICYTDIQPFNEKGTIEKDFGGAKQDLSEKELQRGASLYTLTTFFRNVVTHTPREFCNIKYGDMVIWAQLGDYGKGKFLSSVIPSMYRVHDNGLHSMRSSAGQMEMRIETLMGLYSYRLHKNDSELAASHLEEIMLLSMRTSGIHFSSTLILRLIKSFIFTRVQRFLHK